jgi:hypothetical protein
LDEVAKDLSYSASQKCQALHNAALLAVLQTFDDLAAALDAGASIRAALRARGYTPSSVLMPELAPQEAVALGPLDQCRRQPRVVFPARARTARGSVMQTPHFDFSGDRAALQAELEDALAQLPGLRNAHMAAKTAAEDVCWRFNSFARRARFMGDDLGRIEHPDRR